MEQGRKGVKRACKLLVLAALMTTIAGVFAAAAGARVDAGGSLASGPLVTPTAYSGNMTCKSLLGSDTAYEVKIDPPTSGTYGPVTATFYDDGEKVSFTSTVPVLAVFVKGGNEGGNFYDYRTLTPPGTTADSNLTVPNAQQQISHVSFCWNENPLTLPNLQASKTANGSYDRTVTWSLEKSVDDDSHTGTAGDAFNSTWSVKATKSVQEANYAVAGTITVTNPSTTSSQSFTVSDKLSDGTAASVSCPASIVAPSSSVVCSYTASPTGTSATSNTATVVPGHGATVTATVPVTFAANVNGDESVTLGDARLGYSKSISATTAETFPEPFKCSSNQSDYTDGADSDAHVNTATLNGPNTNLSKDAAVTVNCTLPKLQAAKTAAAATTARSSGRSGRSVSPASHSGNAGAAPAARRGRSPRPSPRRSSTTRSAARSHQPVRDRAVVQRPTS